MKSFSLPCLNGIGALIFTGFQSHVNSCQTNCYRAICRIQYFSPKTQVAILTLPVTHGKLFQMPTYQIPPMLSFAGDTCASLESEENELPHADEYMNRVQRLISAHLMCCNVVILWTVLELWYNHTGLTSTKFDLRQFPTMTICQLYSQCAQD